jgi:CheY-like chemotaxis protein
MKPRRILIVDDNVALARLLKAQLEAVGGFLVRVENHSTAALATAREFQPQVMVLDVMMPGLDGGQVAAQLSRDPDLAKVRVIFLTGSVRREEVEQREGFIGGMPFLAKPVQLDELLEWIDRLAPLPAAKVL